MIRPRSRQLRDEANARGERYYFTGLPCKQGHVANRYVISGCCVECASAYGGKLHPWSKHLGGGIYTPPLREAEQARLEQEKLLAQQLAQKAEQRRLEQQKLELDQPIRKITITIEFEY